MDKMSGRYIISILLLPVLLVPSVYGIHVESSYNGIGYSEDIHCTNDQFIDGSATLSEIGISHSISGTADLDESHFVASETGDYAEVGAQIKGASSIYTYTYELYPSEGIGKTTDHVWASETLNVPGADYIKAYAKARNAAGYNAITSTEVTNGALLGYQNSARASANEVDATQTFASASGSIMASSESYQLPSLTPQASIITAASGIITDYADSVKQQSGIATLDQNGHISGTFSSTAAASGASPVTRTSNYGVDYDILMNAKIDGSVAVATGALGYYIDGNAAQTIQGAVNAAESGDKVNVRSGTYHENVVIDKSLSIKGAGSSTTMVDGDTDGDGIGNGRVFTVLPNTDVAIVDMTIQNGKTGVEPNAWDFASYGGGILNWGSLTVENCEIRSNSATADGGGIASVVANNGGYAALNVKNCNIHDNFAGMYGGGVFSGGGPYSGTNTLNIDNCNIHHNVATEAAGGVFNYGCYWGSKATAIVTNSNIHDNIATIYDAGGIVNQGAYYGTAIIDIKNCNIHHNTAGRYAGGVENCGFRGGNAMMNVIDSDIHHNTAGIVGGGIWNYQWSDNYGPTTAKLNLEHSAISHNDAGRDGGGIYSSGSLVLKDSTIKFNTADADKTDSYVGHGGGIFYTTGSTFMQQGQNKIIKNEPDDISSLA